MEDTEKFKEIVEQIKQNSEAIVIAFNTQWPLLKETIELAQRDLEKEYDENRRIEALKELGLIEDKEYTGEERRRVIVLGEAGGIGKEQIASFKDAEIDAHQLKLILSNSKIQTPKIKDLELTKLEPLVSQLYNPYSKKAKFRDTKSPYIVRKKNKKTHRKKKK